MALAARAPVSTGLGHQPPHSLSGRGLAAGGVPWRAAEPLALALASHASRARRLAGGFGVASVAALLPAAAATHRGRGGRRGCRSVQWHASAASAVEVVESAEDSDEVFGEPGQLFDVPALSKDKPALVVWLHGLGDTGKGWSDTAPALHAMGLPFLHFLFPTAPLRSSANGSGGQGPTPSWYEVETLDSDAIAAMPSPPRGLEEAAQYVLDLVEPYIRRGLDPSRVILAGYSQGAGLALAAACRAPRPLGGVLMLSGWVAEPLENRRPTCPVWMFHGGLDPVIPLATARCCFGMLQNTGARTSFYSYPGLKHGVADEEVTDIAQTLYEALY
eukprot:CAMPEP_0203949042 /NCGR_PEP_ID=MMETSP0359-20131031/83545_1 /ASSEMBLY_ACC=CAM_ASM_000338 /TAXON_ID=268821 /ORGANISM="Scrippsiella Hangoei, Strain SHTV-5" /LENGTH=331 /DNA_ID=CAMNT_0050880825 /DNA_START=26 /DNA_END=1021 /DNA_ORIENTATION=+